MRQLTALDGTTRRDHQALYGSALSDETISKTARRLTELSGIAFDDLVSALRMPDFTAIQTRLTMNLTEERHSHLDIGNPKTSACMAATGTITFIGPTSAPGRNTLPSGNPFMSRPAIGTSNTGRIGCWT